MLMRLAARAVVLSALVGCGAKTGLLLPDVPTDVPEDGRDVADAADVFDAPDRPDACTAPIQPVERLVVESIFVIDRSGSMLETTPSGLTRWTALTRAMERVLPVVDRDLWMGLLQYPEPPLASTAACVVTPSVPLQPRAFNTTPMLTAVRATQPVGGTPTFDALSTAARYFANNPQPTRVRGRYIVLATDGGPNCNGLLTLPCMCTNPRGCGGSRGALSCLDDVRTVDLLERLQSQGIQTFVIGAPGQDVVALEPTLNRLAVAGGRPRDPSAGPSRYYPAADVGDFVTALQQITDSLVRCRYVTNPLRDPTQATVVVGGADVSRDPSHRDGWDWARAEAGEFVLYGAACDRSQVSGVPVRVRDGCPTE